MPSKSILTIVGAGPGDAGLITVKGLKAVQRAKVILYDALVSPEILQEAASNCRLIYVGKRKAKKEFSQEEINQLLVFYAQRFENVVRLKGGDPFVFGRGHEESEYLKQQGIEVDIIPGISSAYSAPTAAGIPLTKRGVNESFWIVTGTLSTGQISEDLYKAAQTSATIVVLMGFYKLTEIANAIASIRGKSEPMAIIQNATLPTQQIVIGNAANIVEKAVTNKIGSPAVIVIGKVVEFSTIGRAIEEFSYERGAI